MEDTLPGTEISADGVEDIPKNLPPTAEADFKAFATAEKVLKGVNILINIAFTVEMIFDLAQNWDKYNDVGKALGVLQIAVQGLTVMLDTAAFIGEAVAAAGLISAECMALAVIPVLGAILVIIGVVIMAVLSALNLIKKEPPKKTPVEEFLGDKGHILVEGFPDLPQSLLTYSGPSKLQQNADSLVTLTATNQTDKDVTLSRIEFSLEVGQDDAALFSARKFSLMAILESIRTHVLWLLGCVTPRQGLYTALVARSSYLLRTI